MNKTISDTQIDSWDSLQPTISEKRQKVLDRIIDSDYRGMTLFELEEVLQWPINRISGRVTELAKMGRIIDSFHRRTNPKSNKAGIVWIKR